MFFKKGLQYSLLFSRIVALNKSGLLAQLVERLTLNQHVVGSIPTQPTILSSPGPLAQLVERLTLNQHVVGSIPTRPTKAKVAELVDALVLGTSGEIL